jgi:hypothetical protein
MGRIYKDNYYNLLVEYVVDAIKDEVDAIHDRDGICDMVAVALHGVIENEIIYTAHCREIVEKFDYDVFQGHGPFGRAESIEQAAYACLWDLCYSDADDFIFDVMEAVGEKTGKTVHFPG